jgi:hypothetical protein
MRVNVKSDSGHSHSLFNIDYSIDSIEYILVESNVSRDSLTNGVIVDIDNRSTKIRITSINGSCVNQSTIIDITTTAGTEQ